MNIVYHYTKIESLLGIFGEYQKTKPCMCFWASHYLFANDPLEKKIGEDMLFRYLPEIEEEMGIDLEKRITYLSREEKWKEAFTQVHSRLRDRHIENSSSYYLSFSQTEDSLPMWSMYGNNGTGISIGLNKNKLIKFFKKTRNTDMAKCWYNIENNIENWKFIIKENYKECLEIQSRQRDTYINDTKFKNNEEKEKALDLLCSMMTLQTLIGNVTSAFKDPAYGYEQEYKVIFSDLEENVYYRSSANYILPYIKIYIPMEYLEKIIIGPTLNYDLTKMSILKFLDSKEILSDKVEIMQSKVPYRS